MAVLDKNEILIVAASGHYRSMLGQLLTGAGYAVATAEPERATVRCETKRPDLVLFDLRTTPELRQLELLRQSQPDIPVIFLASWGNWVLAHNAQSLGAHYLPKITIEGEKSLKARLLVKIEQVVLQQPESFLERYLGLRT